jgi:hypothetical protein
LEATVVETVTMATNGTKEQFNNYYYSYNNNLVAGKYFVNVTDMKDVAYFPANQ